MVNVIYKIIKAQDVGRYDYELAREKPRHSFTKTIFLSEEKKMDQVPEEQGQVSIVFKQMVRAFEKMALEMQRRNELQDRVFDLMEPYLTVLHEHGPKLGELFARGMEQAEKDLNKMGGDDV